MRIAWLLALAMLAGCTRATAIGTPCVVDKDCNVKGQRCVSADGAKICTHACTAQAGASGCPIGYDCTPADATHASDLTCNKERYAFDPVSGAPLLFGKSCALAAGATQAEWDAACAGSGDPAASPACRHAADPQSRATPRMPLKNDAHAYCTGACTSNGDCPIDML